jgi:putative hydrolase of the HAD superfamily
MIKRKVKKKSVKPSRKPRYKNIIFDLGGVIFEWNPDYFLPAILKTNTQAIDYFRTILNSGLWRSFDRGTVSIEQAAEKIDPKFDKALYVDFCRKLPKYITPVKEMVQIFYKVKKLGFKTYMLSNFPKELFEEVSKKNEFLKEFDGSVISYKVKEIKPEPEIYKTLLEKYSLNPEECLFLDDRKENLEAAKKIGIDGILVEEPKKVTQELKLMQISL